VKRTNLSSLLLNATVVQDNENGRPLQALKSTKLDLHERGDVRAIWAPHSRKPARLAVPLRSGLELSRVAPCWLASISWRDGNWDASRDNEAFDIGEFFIRQLG